MHDPLVVVGRIGLRRHTFATIWHVEPGGHDSLSVCGRRPDGSLTSVWHWHVHHWRIRFDALHLLRRRLLTRCEICSGPDRKHHRVNVARSWDGPEGRFWQGEPGLSHMDCMARWP